MPESLHLDPLFADLRVRLNELAHKHKYWEVRIHVSDGIARIETICQEPNKYALRPDNRK